MNFVFGCSFSSGIFCIRSFVPIIPALSSSPFRELIEIASNPKNKTRFLLASTPCLAPRERQIHQSSSEECVQDRTRSTRKPTP